MPDKFTWPTSVNHGAVMPANPGRLGWNLTGKNYSSEPIHATLVPSSAWGTRFVATIIGLIDLAALNGLLHRALYRTKCHNKLLFSKWWLTTDFRFNPYQTTSSSNFHNYQNPRWNWCAFLFLFSIPFCSCWLKTSALLLCTLDLGS